LTSDRKHTQYNTVVMVRAKDRLNATRIEGIAVEDLTRPLLVFFHGDAIDLIADESSPWVELARQSGIELAYCTTAWQRRRNGLPAAAVRPSSLVQFWAHQMACWQACTDPDLNEQPVLIRLIDAQPALGWQERLEVMLAAATLEIPLSIQFEADAWCSLADAADQRRAWQQLLDFELADIEVLGVEADPDQVSLGVRYAPAAARDRAGQPAVRRIEL